MVRGLTITARAFLYEDELPCAWLDRSPAAGRDGPAAAEQGPVDPVADGDIIAWPGFNHGEAPAFRDRTGVQAFEREIALGSGGVPTAELRDAREIARISPCGRLRSDRISSIRRIAGPIELLCELFGISARDIVALALRWLYDRRRNRPRHRGQASVRAAGAISKARRLRSRPIHAAPFR